MNTSRLREILDLLRESEEYYKIQEILSQLNAAISNIVNSPQDTQQQTDYSNALMHLRENMQDMISDFEPAQLELIEEIGADRFFTVDLPGQISEIVQENPITPAVARDYVTDLMNKRQAYLSDLDVLCEKLEQLGIEATDIEAGTSEIGFIIPRQLFANQFEQLLKQLNVINNILRKFSETATGAVEDIEVKQISSSDPLFFFGLDPTTVALLGGAITWALHTWKTMEEIREIRRRVSEVPSIDKTYVESLDDQMKKIVAEEINKEATRLKKLAHKDDSRTAAEQLNQTKWALEMLLALVERGLKVEIRYLAPSGSETEADEEPEDIPPAFQTLEETVRSLVFPKITTPPVLELPPSEPKPARKTGTKKT